MSTIAKRLRGIADTTERYSDRHSQWVAENLRHIATELEAAPAADVEMLDAIEAHTNWELAYTREPEDDEPWEVYARTGPVNDQEWNLIAKGKTVREAIRAAMRKAKS